MRRLGELAQKHDKIVAYEPVCWGMYVNRWQQSNDIINRVDLPNVKHCLDTFHIAALETSDPFNAECPIRPGSLEDLDAELDEMRKTLKAGQIGYVQLSDAAVADLNQIGYPQRDLTAPPLMTLSRNCRMFPCEPAEYGGVLPAFEVAKAIFELGYRGWVSMEVFHVDLWKQNDRYVHSTGAAVTLTNLCSVPQEWARRGMASWQRVAARCGLPGNSATETHRL